MRKIFTLGLLLMLPAAGLMAQRKSLPALQLSGRSAAFEDPAGLQALAPAAADPVQVYLHFDKAPDKVALRASGILLEDAVQQNVYLALLTARLTATQWQTAGIDGWSVPQAKDKINPLLLEPGNSSEKEELLISVTRGTSFSALQQQLKAYDAILSAAQSWKSQDVWQVTVPAEKITALASASFIRFINPLMKPQHLNNQAIGFTNAQGAHQPLSVGGHNLHGEGVTVGVGDDSDPDHVDYNDRLIKFNPVLASTHGFHTVGTVGGNGIVDERYKGFAPKATIVSDFFDQVIANGATYNQDFGMIASNNSYGNILGSCSYAGTYDIYTQYADQQMLDMPELLTIFAAGNDGNLNCTPYPQRYATVAGSYQTAKNVLTVGNVGKTPEIGSLSSSRGPVKDGRLKPEIAAVGTVLWSTVDNNSYGWNTGTSMACPNVTGGTALLYQRYKQLHGGQNPKGALIKAVLMNGASDLDNPGPDFRFGFGLMNIGHSLTMLDSARYFYDSVNTAQERNFTVTIPANTAKAKIMLYWNDPAAAPLSAHALINDLDLSVLTPASTTVLPLVLDTLPSQVTAAATQGIDRINNVEQVTLNNPAAGAYTVKVKGYNVPEINQEFYVVYDFTPTGVSLQYPYGAEVLNASDSIRVYWEASDDPNPFTLSYSADNGSSWNTINSNIPATQDYYVWYPPAGITSTQCLVRVTRNNTGQQSQSSSFALMGRPVVTLNPTVEQCPGSIKVSWNAIPGATSYQLYRKIGIDMAPVATVTGTTYTFTGLHPDTTYWVSVSPVINGVTGMRGVAVSRQPADGSCTGIVAHGDLRMNRLIAPVSGRQLTTTALDNTEPLTLLVSNLDNQAAANYKIAYKINNGAWNSASYTDIITPAGNRQFTLGSLDLSAPGTYAITVAVTNQAMADPVPGNDTLVVTVKQLANPAMNLSGGYTEDFENTGIINITGYSVTGLEGIDRWDFTQSKPKGRLRSFVNSAITIQGNRSASMDNNGNQRNDIAGSSYNTLSGTFNLSNYNTTNWEVRCEFDYLLHGVPKFDTGNKAWVRGSDSDPWLPLLLYQIDTNNLGQIHNSGTLSLTDILTAGGQNFSSSTQIRFTQYDTSRIAAPYFGNGLTMDNFRLYLVTDDVSLLSLDSVYHYNCGLSNQVPVKIKVRNGVNNTVYNIAVYYQLDNQPVVSGLIDSIAGKDTVEYTFAQPVDLSANADYHLSSWIYVPTDTYRLNDSIMNFRIRNQPVIAAFPYLQDFETNDGYFYAEGNNSSWAYGTPASPKINHAASGSKAWKTNLQGNYNKLEFSYLYSPCFDISTLSNPTLSFHMASDIEDPGSSVFDIAYVEYSHDGYNWTKLGAAGQGTNWYGNDSAQAWTHSGETYWHVATIPLPTDGNIVSFRFVMRADQGTELEGLAIDDIHVYDRIYPIFDQAQFPGPVSQSIVANQQYDVLSGGSIGAAIHNGSSALGLTSVQDYKHTTFINDDSTQYYLPKNFTIQTANAPGDSVTLRFYVPDEAIRTIREDNVCYSCSKVREVMQLGITKYDDPNKSVENNTLADNLNGVYSFIPKGKLRWVPYDIGYYAELKVKSFSEFWFNDGGPTKDQPLNTNLFDFTASHYGSRYALLDWTSYIDAQATQYEVQRADASLSFTTIATVAALGNNGQNYSYLDTPRLNGGATVYYRIRYHMQDGGTYLSLVRSLDWSGSEPVVRVYPNPVRNGILNLDWFKGTGDGLQWSMYSLVGQRVMTGYTETNGFDGKYTFDLSKMGLSAGVYILKVVSAKDKWEFKIVYQ